MAIAPMPPTTNDIASVPISALIRNRVTITPFARPIDKADEDRRR